MDPIKELKARAEILHNGVLAGENHALERLRILPELRRLDTRALATRASGMRLKHCLAVGAAECGFAGWERARRVLEGDPSEKDYGTLLYPAGRGRGTGSTLNPWFASCDEARDFVAQEPPGHGRLFLLAFKRHFFVVDRLFIEGLGIDPDEPDWEAIGWDWASPADASARGRLYCRRLMAMRAAQ